MGVLSSCWSAEVVGFDSETSAGVGAILVNSLVSVVEIGVYVPYTLGK